MSSTDLFLSPDISRGHSSMTLPPPSSSSSRGPRPPRSSQPPISSSHPTSPPTTTGELDVYSHPAALAYTSAHPRRTIPKFGPYLLLQTLGEGEFGKVKLGLHVQYGEEVAVKLIRRGSVTDSVRLSKVEREIEVLRNLKHANIVRLYDVIETDKYIGIILEYASGGELFDHILAHRYLREKDACKLFAQLLSGVWYIHAKKIVHRDLKLENLLLDRNRNVIITDFGFANRFEHKTDDLMQTSCGSPCYAAPELVISEGAYVGSAVDVWSSGVILYAMLAGYLPFDDDPANPDGDNINLLYKYIVNTPLTFPEYVSAEARDLLSIMLVADPAHRADLETVMQHRWLAPYRSMFSRTVEDLERVALEQQHAKRLAYQRQLRSATQQNQQAQPQSERMARTYSQRVGVEAAPAGPRNMPGSATSPEFLYDTSARRQVASAAIVPPPARSTTAVSQEDPFAMDGVSTALPSITPPRPSREQAKQAPVAFQSPDKKDKGKSRPHTIQVEYEKPDDEEVQVQATPSKKEKKRVEQSPVRERTRRVSEQSRTLPNVPPLQIVRAQQSQEGTEEPRMMTTSPPITLSKSNSVRSRSTGGRHSRAPSLEKFAQKGKTLFGLGSSGSGEANGTASSRQASDSSAGSLKKEVAEKKGIKEGEKAKRRNTLSLMVDPIRSFKGRSKKSPAPQTPTGEKPTPTPTAEEKENTPVAENVPAVAPAIVLATSVKQGKEHSPVRTRAPAPASALLVGALVPEPLQVPAPTPQAPAPTPARRFDDRPTALPASTTKARKVMNWFRNRSKGQVEDPVVEITEVGVQREERVEVEDRAATPTMEMYNQQGSSSSTVNQHQFNQGTTTPQVTVTAAPPMTSATVSAPATQRSTSTSSTPGPFKQFRNAVSPHHHAHSPFHNNHNHQQKFTALKVHQGPIDQTTITNGSPPDVMGIVMDVLLQMGLDVTKETEFKLRCVRRKRARSAGSTSGVSAFQGVGSAASNGVDRRGLPAPSSSSNSGKWRGILSRRNSSQVNNNQSLSFDADTVDVESSLLAHVPSAEPIYGDRAEDLEDEVRLSVELTRIDRLEEVYSLDIRRLKGNLRSYKFLYDTIRQRCNLPR